MKLSELLARFGLTTAKPAAGDLELTGARSLRDAGPGDLSFLANAKYRTDAEQTRAAAILVAKPVDGCGAVQILCKNPYAVWAQVLQWLFPESTPPPGVHPTAVIDASAQIGADCTIGPFCVIEAGASLGDRCVLGPGVHLGRDVVLGDDCRLFAHVVVYAGCKLGDRVRLHAQVVIGADGFGYAQDGGRHLKIPQIGAVTLHDDVEVGAGTTIDRGALEDTVVGEGTKIDNLAQIGHGVKIGKHCILVSQAAISGSATLGDYVVVAGKSGTVGHVRVGDQVVIMGDSVVTKDLKGPGQYAGNPAVPHMTYQRQLAALRRLPELAKRVSALEKTNAEDKA